MTMDEIFAEVAKENGKTKAEITTILKSAFFIIGQHIHDGCRVRVPGFGTFQTKVRAARSFTVPDGRKFDVPDTVRVTFKPSYHITEGAKPPKSYDEELAETVAKAAGHK